MDNDTTLDGSEPVPTPARSLSSARAPGNAAFSAAVDAIVPAREARARHTYEPGDTLTDGDRETVRLGDKLGEGGEGQLFAVDGRCALAAKLYFNRSTARRDKLRAMIRNPPAEPGGVRGHVSFCWPTQLLYGSTDVPAAGFLMHRVDSSSAFPVSHLYHPATREAVAPGFHWGYLLRTAGNIASVVEALHKCGHVLGDINESNFLVSPQALVTLVDCDSMQVPRPGGGYFRCPVGKEEFLAPELQGADFSAVDRNALQDCFSLATLVFMVLMEGTHPFSGIWLGPGEDRVIGRRIASGDSPYAHSRNVARSPLAPPFEMVPPALRALFVRCFGRGISQPLERPSARAWREALEAAERELVICGANPLHRHAPHLATCPWCERAQMLEGADPFPRAGPQRSMSPASVSRRSAMRVGWSQRPRERQVAGRTPEAPAPVWRRWRPGLAAAGLVILTAAGLTGYILTRTVAPEEEKRLQQEHVAQLQRRGQMTLLRRYLEDSALRAELLQRPGIETRAVQGFAAARPLWAPDEISCNVAQGTPLVIRTYIDNTGYFSAEGHYTVAVTLPDGACGRQAGLVIAPMSALPAPLRLLDCPGRGGSLQGFAWHSTLDWSCAAPASPPPAR